VAASEEVDKDHIKDELADVFAYVFLLAEKHGLDVKEIVLERIKRNGEKYPVDKAKGTAKKVYESMIDDFILSVQINKYEFSKEGSVEYALNTYMKNSWPIVYAPDIHYKT
jgi:hypothetical protein